MRIHVTTRYNTYAVCTTVARALTFVILIAHRYIHLTHPAVEEKSLDRLIIIIIIMFFLS